MNDLRTAAQQALEAMRCGVPTGRITLYEWDRALSDLDAALAQEQAEPFTPDAIAHTQAAWKMGYEARRAEEAEPVQEPVAFVNAAHLQGLTLGLYAYAEIYTADSVGRIPLYTAPPKAEPLTEEEIDRIRAAEREACAKVCDDKAKETFSGQCQVWGDYFARAIRARSKSC